MKETSKLPYPTGREQKRTWEYYYGINDKSQKVKDFLYINKRFIFYILPFYVFFFQFAVFQDTPLLRICEGNLCLSHVVAQNETRSHFLPLIGVIC